MNKPRPSHLHPVEEAGALEGPFRRLIQNPVKIVGRYVRPGMTIVDLGCGTGYFTFEMAGLAGPTGKVIAADVQDGMLEILRRKLEGDEMRQNIMIHKCGENHLGLTEKVDFILAFYAFHEMEYIDEIIPELKGLLKPEAEILIAEQKFHVPKHAFDTLVRKMADNGFVICERPGIFFSRAVVMRIGN